MVRLKVVDAGTDVSGVIRFQFHNGSIKSSPSNLLAALSFKFQFHNGSIKSTCVSACRFSTFVFQFHNGSIKRNESEGTQSLPDIFQFHNGSIKRQQDGIKFQFHNGSIKSYWKSISPPIITNFNSTMVRLKVNSVLVYYL